MTPNTQDKSVDSVQLTVHGPDDTTSTHELSAGDMLLVGSGVSCGIVLQDADVAAMHCTLSLVGSAVHVRDWSTTAGTYVGGQKVDYEMTVPTGTDIKIGSHRIEINFVPASADSVAIQTLDKVDSLLGTATATADVDGDAWSPETPETEFDGDAENSFDDYDTETYDTDANDTDDYDTAAFDDDTLELLKAEVELLQSELAERDARLAELESLADFDGDYSESQIAEDSPEVERLVERLEQLLDELERSDERMSTMADLLRTAEDASAAESEERRQIESWISEIERRLTEREAERKAEQQVLEKSVVDLTAQLKRAERQLERTPTGNSASASQDEYLTQLRNEYDSLEQKLRDSEANRDRLLEQLDSADVKNVAAQTQAAIDDALREERLTIAQERTEFSQERAKLARDKAELSRLRDQMNEEQHRFESNPDSADQRIRAFRDHLREIHETEPAAVQPQGLSARMGRLWRRIEGRPLDTD